MSGDTPMHASTAAPAPRRNWYARIPLYVRIAFAMVLGAAVGRLLGPRCARLRPFSDIVLQLLKLLATPLIFVAVIHALMKAQATGRMAARLTWFLMSNTVVAILVGLLVANVLHPGTWKRLSTAGPLPAQKPFNAAEDLLGKVPRNLIDPFQTNEILSIIILAIAFGIALRIVRGRQIAAGQTSYQAVEALLDAAFQLVMVMLHWIFELVPLAVFAVVARTVGTEGFGPLLAMGGFVLAVLLALTIQAIFYLVRLSLGSWVRPGRFLSGASDALFLAFSTASSAATLPVTYSCMTAKIGVREESAGMGVMVGGTFNHDGTALYEAMAALFISQAIGQHLTLGHQVVVIFMSVIASVGAAGIPEAGLVTMLAVFSAVRLPIEYIPLLLPLDWFLDRCRTAINVMGDMSVTCLLDGKQPPPRQEAAIGIEREELTAVAE
jgi:Na+/H+-dicarboxylate symporter